MIMSKYDFSKRSEVKKYFNDILPGLKDKKIKGIYTPCPFTFNNDSCLVMTDLPVYVMFEDDKNLVFEYDFVDELKIEYREMTEKEKEEFEKAHIKDYFNYKIDIYNPNISSAPISNKSVELTYGCIVDVEVEQIFEKYAKWLDTGLDYVPPTIETFNKIKFIMDNGNKFDISAEDAEFDGYTLVDSYDAIAKEEVK
jgi:hypothetical protein